MMPTPFESHVRRIAVMDRQGLVEFIQGLRCNFKLDFTDEFLNDVSLERLRHIATGAMLHSAVEAKSSLS
jgi:hypothetical protein